jgi:plasmid replication initiation protein
MRPAPLRPAAAAVDCCRAAPTLPDQRRSRRLPAPVAAHAGKAARDRRRPAFRKFGRRVMYAVADLDAWAAERSFETHFRSRVRRAALGGQPCALIAGARVAFAMSSPSLPSRQRPLQEREQLDLFRALPGDMAPRDSQDLMAFPFFSLAKSRRTAPIDFRAGNVTIRVEGTQEHGIATIWDADVLIWAASADRGSTRRGPAPVAADAGHALRDPALHRARYVAARLPAPQGRAGSPAIDHGGHVHPRDDRAAPASLLVDQRVEGTGRCQAARRLGLELILPDWFYAGVLDAALVLTIDPAYFRLTGGIERWLYRLVRKHGGQAAHGWQFDFQHLYRKSGSVARYYDFACDLRALVARQSLPGYVGHRAYAGISSSC